MECCPGPNSRPAFPEEPPPFTCRLNINDVEMDFEGLSACGNRLGTAAIIVFDRKTCLLAATLNLTRFFARGILRMVHAVPRGAAIPGRSAVAY